MSLLWILFFIFTLMSYEEQSTTKYVFKGFL